ncbi:response regulator transcription factor [Gracilibacillus kekensis]|uniref:Two-component system, response regulator YesN n=1 Tax=Gracilibacillus kekensis TaxID=1027249 RepID=A0A1M7PXP4_9BACI|nr:response regulator [Gracilibacillus kekensis]SHN22393.1 two-component system, response regulator YesN [Gracilibacillus kekensis]
MYRVVLVDDDKLVTKFMEKMIPWEETGFEVIASFQDSLQAYDYLTKHHCDVLITDIGMPNMNGIEMMQKLKENKQGMQTNFSVVLSCHDEFYYAQQALKLEAYDYILKESMEEEQIIELLHKLKKTMDETDRTKSQQIKISKFLQKNNMSLKTKFIETILQETYMYNESWWKEQEELLGMDFSTQRYTVVLSFVDNYYLTINRYQSDTLLQFSINNIVEEVLKQYHPDIQIFYLQRKFIILFPIEGNNQSSLSKTTEQVLKEVHQKLNNYLKVSITTVIAENNQNRQDLVTVIKHLLNQEEQRFYYQSASIQRYQLIHYSQASIFEEYGRVVDSLKTHILNKEPQQITNYLKKEMERIQSQKYPPKMVKDWAMKLILDIKLNLHALVHFDDRMFQSLTSRDIQEVENMEELEATISQICQQFIEHVHTIEAVPKNEDVMKAQRYVRTHLHEKITLKDTADFLHLNPSYFSRVFKKETGESFIEYVTKLKMEKAKELLDTTTVTVEQLSADLGFDNKSYFLKTFKKYTSMSPKDYKFKRNISQS